MAPCEAHIQQAAMGAQPSCFIYPAQAVLTGSLRTAGLLCKDIRSLFWAQRRIEPSMQQQGANPAQPQSAQ